MKPGAFILLLATCTSQADIRQEKPDNAAPPRRGQTAAPPATTFGDSSCPHCNRDEQLVVDLIYYKQLLDILEEINRQREQIDAGLLASVHAELMKLRPDLAGLLKTRSKLPAPAASPKKKPQQPAQKPVRPDPAATKQGIDGLAVGHVNDENKELGIEPSVVLISNGRPRSFNVGSIVEHNRNRFKIVKVDYVEDQDKGSRHEVHLEDQANQRLYVVPWQ